MRAMLVVLLILVPVSVFAQTQCGPATCPTGTTHCAQVNWQSVSTVNGYNVYRCSGTTCTAGVLQNASLLIVPGYTDLGVTAGGTYTWYVTGVCSTTSSTCTPGESKPSTVITCSIPKDVAVPPSGVGVTVN